jgi:hypothetical protein
MLKSEAILVNVFKSCNSNFMVRGAEYCGLTLNDSYFSQATLMLINRLNTV